MACACTGGLFDSPEPPRRREHQSRPQFQVVLEPSFALVQDSPADGLARIHCRTGGQLGDCWLGLGILGRFRNRLGRAVVPGRPGNDPRLHPDPPVTWHLSQASASLVQPGERHLAVTRLVGRDRESTSALARSSLLDRADDPATIGSRATSSSETGSACPQISVAESASG